MNPSELKQAIESIADSFSKSNMEDHQQVLQSKDVLDAIELIQQGNAEDFYYSFMYPIDQYVSAVFDSSGIDSKSAFIIEHYSFFNRILSNTFTTFEGSACCADKSRTIIRAVLKFYNDNAPIEFDYNQEYTYHLPKTILNNHEDIIAFINSIRRLYSGYPDEYCNMIDKFNNIVTTKFK